MFSDTADVSDPFLARMEEISYRYKGRYAQCCALLTGYNSGCCCCCGGGRSAVLQS
jgi:hypothetical protein